MLSLPTPSKIEVEEIEKNKGKILIEPCFPGYGITLGNSLRRVLLSSLEGGAVTAFKIKNVQHEFSAIDNVKEDVVEISLNLKQLRLKVFSDEPVRITLKAKGEKKVTAKDIEKNSDVEVVNPDLHIATLTEKSAEFEMDIVVRKGRGYSTSESREDELEVGMVALDALFSPIERVNFTVENVRVGQMTNWDKLIMEVDTDGSVSPKEAVNQATQFLIEHFNFIETSTQGDDDKKPKKKRAKKEVVEKASPEQEESVETEETEEKS
jgi:DNA-directed RNA polymerase subunit alpha